MSSMITLESLVDDAAFFSLEHQLHLVDVAEQLGEHRWQVNLDERTLDLIGEGTLRTTIGFLGSTAESTGTWLWGWANPSGFSAEVTALSQQTSDYGREHGVAELANPELPLTPDIAARLTDAAKLITGHWNSYSGQAGPGTRVYFLIDAPELVLPAPTVPRVLRVLGEALMTGMVGDHRRALASYARQRQLDVAFSPDGSSAQVRLPDGGVGVEFDHHGRINSMSGTPVTV